jgi:hypothetical protein
MPFCSKMLVTAVRRWASSLSTGITNETLDNGNFELTPKPYLFEASLGRISFFANELQTLIACI